MEVGQAQVVHRVYAHWWPGRVWLWFRGRDESVRFDVRICFIRLPTLICEIPDVIHSTKPVELYIKVSLIFHVTFVIFETVIGLIWRLKEWCKKKKKNLPKQQRVRFMTNCPNV